MDQMCNLTLSHPRECSASPVPLSVGPFEAKLQQIDTNSIQVVLVSVWCVCVVSLNCELQSGSICGANLISYLHRHFRRDASCHSARNAKFCRRNVLTFCTSRVCWARLRYDKCYVVDVHAYICMRKCAMIYIDTEILREVGFLHTHIATIRMDVCMQVFIQMYYM